MIFERKRVLYTIHINIINIKSGFSVLKSTHHEKTIIILFLLTQFLLLTVKPCNHCTFLA